VTLDGQHLEMFGGTLVKMTTPVHSAPGCTNKCSDDYATTTIYYTAPVGGTVQLLFAATWPSPLNRGGWGPGPGHRHQRRAVRHQAEPLTAPIGQRTTRSWGRRSSRRRACHPTLPSLQTATPARCRSDRHRHVERATDPTGPHFNLRFYDTSTTSPTAPPQRSELTRYGPRRYNRDVDDVGHEGRLIFTSPGVTTATKRCDSENTGAGPHGCGDATEIVTVAKLTRPR
jgi:hypothetical protein